MQLPVNPPVLPMLAKRVDEIPQSGDWIFEPKWDGFRALIFRDHDEILIQSRDTKPLDRYFPEVVEMLRKQLPERCVLDGEIVIANATGLDFDALQLRIHPAASRIKLLSRQTPASFVAFDLLALNDEDLTTPARSPSAVPAWSTCWPTPPHRSTSRPQPATGPPRPTGSPASRAQASTA